MSKNLKALLDLVNLLGVSDDTEGGEGKPKEEPTYTKADIEKAQKEALQAAQDAAEAAKKEGEKKTPEVKLGAEGVDKSDVIDYESEFKEQQDDLVLTKVESGLGAQGVELDFKNISEFITFDKLKDERGRPSQEKIDEFVSAVSSIATKTPPRGKKRVDRKPGMAAYLDEA